MYLFLFFIIILILILLSVNVIGLMQIKVMDASITLYFFLLMKVNITKF